MAEAVDRSWPVRIMTTTAWFDMFVGNLGEPPRLYHNQEKLNGRRNHWPHVKVVGRGTGPGTTNRLTVG